MLSGISTILPFTACLFWTMVMLLDWRRDNGAQHVLTLFMGVSAVLYLCHAVFFNHVLSLLGVSECVYAFCNIAVFPIYYLYIYRLTDRRGLSPRQLAVLLPAVVISLWAVVLHVLRPGDTAAGKTLVTVMRIVFMVQLVPVCWASCRRLRAFDQEIANSYADTEGRSVRPTRRMLWLLVGGTLISGAANFMGREYFDGALLLFPSVVFTILLFGVGYVGKRQEFCIDDLVRDDQAPDPEPVTDNETAADSVFDSDPADTPAERSQTILDLDSIMEKECLYLQTDLRLSEVAAMLGVGRTTLSQRINQELGLSFSDYVNNLRVDHACRLLADPDNRRLSMAALAEKSGFSSDSSFYRAFRRRTGITPKQYISQGPAQK